MVWTQKNWKFLKWGWVIEREKYAPTIWAMIATLKARKRMVTYLLATTASPSTIVHVMKMPDLIIISVGQKTCGTVGHRGFATKLFFNNHKARECSSDDAFFKEIHGTIFVLYILWHQVSAMKKALVTTKSTIDSCTGNSNPKTVKHIISTPTFLYSVTLTFNPLYRPFENI